MESPLRPSTSYGSLGSPYNPRRSANSFSRPSTGTTHYTESTSVARLWQNSSSESNYVPVQTVPNLRTSEYTPLPLKAELAKKSLEKSPPKIDATFESKSIHEKLYISGRYSPTSLAASLGATKSFREDFKTRTFSPTKPRVSEIKFGHEFSETVTPETGHFEAYTAGVHVESPLRIVSHNKRGVKLPKVSAGRSPVNVIRTYSGGFYANS